MTLNKDVKSMNINIGYNIELLIKYPKKKSDKVCLFVNGLNADKIIINHLDNDCFKDKYLVTFNHRQWDDNIQKSTKNPKTYIKDIYKIVSFLKREYHDKKIYLLGESWGCALSIIFMYKYPNLIEKGIVWNMPYGLQKIDNKNEKNKFVMRIKMLTTFFLNIETKSFSFFPEELTNNKVLARSIRIRNISKKTSNKVIIASWKSLRKAWKILNKNINKMDLIYIQGMKDILISNKKINYLKNHYQDLIDKKIFLLSEGTHILTMDDIESNNLFEIIDNNI